jgi:hypothetical protein
MVPGGILSIAAQRGNGVSTSDGNLWQNAGQRARGMLHHVGLSRLDLEALLANYFKSTRQVPAGPAGGNDRGLPGLSGLSVMAPPNEAFAKRDVTVEASSVGARQQAS